MVNPIGLNIPQKNRLTTRQMNKLRKLIGEAAYSQVNLCVVQAEGWGDMVKEAEQENVEAEAALDKYLDSLLEKK